MIKLGELIEKISKALADLQNGRFVLVYDSEKREGETDLVMASQYVNSESIKKMRKDGGGLIFLMTSKEVADRLQLPFLADMYEKINDRYPVLNELAPDDIPYDTKSSFSLYINHRDTFTGITDIDRSLTMRKFAELIERTNTFDSDLAVKQFGKEFRSPGHVPLCVAAKNLLNNRRGHTELVIALLQMAKLTPAGSGCEILGNNGRALSKSDAITYAKNNKLIFLEGKEIVQVWKKWSK